MGGDTRDAPGDGATAPPGDAPAAVDRPVPRVRRWRGLTVAGLAVTLALVVVAARALDPAEVWEALRASEGRWVVPAALALALATLFRALRWRALLVSDVRPPVRAVLAALLVGDLFNNVLPARAGEAARLFALHRRARVPRTQIGATIVVERIFDVLVLLLLLLVSLPWLPAVSWLRAAAVIGVALGLTVAAGVVLLALFGDAPLRVLFRPLRWIPYLPVARLEAAPRNAAAGLAGLTDLPLALQALALTVAAWLCGIVSCWLVMLGFPFNAPPLAALLVVVATALGMGIPSAPASLGVFEAATVVALAAYAVPAAAALSFALVLHALSFFGLVAAGLVVLAHGRRSAEQRLPASPERPV